MPPAPARRQPAEPAEGWFSRAASLRILLEIQRQAAPELTRVFGHTGLYLRPSAALPPLLSGNMLAQVLSLHRQEGAWAGDVHCSDQQLPFGDGSLALVYGLCVLETSPEPRALLAEIARVLRPDGAALLVSLNPWSPGRVRWAFRGLRPLEPAILANQVGQAGLEVQRRHYLGPLLVAPSRVDVSPRRGSRIAARLRVASLLVARRRDPGVTPLRHASPAMNFRPGMSAG